jgi:kynurenine formamidase
MPGQVRFHQVKLKTQEESNMRPTTGCILCIAIGSAFILAGPAAQAQSWQPPADAARCPSKWGAGDQRGSANHMKPETVLRAAKLIRAGEVIELGHVLNSSMPFFGTRRFDVHTKRTFMNPQSNRRGSNEELVVGEIGQVGTQFDGFAHQTIGAGMYNCFKVDEAATRNGFEKLGIENAGSLITRGVLVDVAALKGADILPDNYEITVQDIEQALERQKLKLQSGDAVIIHTGWGKLWGKDNARYARGCPGIGVAAAEWLAKQDPMLVGADNIGVEVSPNPDPKVSLPVHQIMLVVNGIHLLENLKLDELAAKRVYEFAFIVQPLKIQGGTGSTVAPIAVR